MKKTVIALLASLTVGASVWAQTPPQDIDLPTLLDWVHDLSPRLAIERQSVEAAQAERLSAGAWPNPSLGYTQSRQPGTLTNFSSARAREWTLEFPLLVGGQRGARLEAAQRAIDAARARVSLSEQDLAADAALAHVHLLVAQERLALQEEGLSRLQALREIVSSRLASGLASRYELLRFDVEVASGRQNVADAHAELLQAQSDLASTLALHDWHPRALGSLRALAEPAEEAQESVAADHVSNLAVQLARQDEALAGAGVELARRERWPAVSLNVARFWTERPYGATQSVGATVELPLFDSREGALGKALAEARSATLKRELIEVENKRMRQQHAQTLLLRHRSLLRFEEDTAQKLGTLHQMAEDAYRLGKGSVLELLDASRSNLQIRLERVDMIQSVIEARIRLLVTRSQLVGAWGHGSERGSTQGAYPAH